MTNETMDLNPGPHEIKHGRHRRIHRALVVPTSVTRLGDFFGLWATYFSKPLATINLPKSLILLGNFGEGVKIYHFYSEIIFRQLL